MGSTHTRAPPLSPPPPLVRAIISATDSLNSLDTSRERMEYPSLMRVSPATIT